MLRIYFIVFSLLFLSPISTASAAPAADYIEMCNIMKKINQQGEQSFTKQDIIRGMLCYGTMTGLVDGYWVQSLVTAVVNDQPSEKFQLICIPESVTTIQLIDVWLDYMDKNQGAGEEIFGAVVHRAIYAQFPCRS